MACQITFTRRVPDRGPQRAFTLAEVLVGTALSSILLAGVLSTFLLMGRTGANVVNYSAIESQARKALDLFSSEVRMAYAVGATYSATSVTLSIPDKSSARKGSDTTNGAYTVTYTFDTANKLLTRTVNAGTPVTLLTGVERIPGNPSPEFLTYYKTINKGTLLNPGDGYDTVAGNVAGNLAEINQMEVSFLLQRKDVGVTSATNKVLSARFILRNK